MSDGRGRAPGEKLGGRQKGTKNKKTIERENLLSRAIGELSRPLGKDVLAEVMMELRRLAQERSSEERTASTVRRVSPLASSPHSARFEETARGRARRGINPPVPNRSVSFARILNRVPTGYLAGFPEDGHGHYEGSAVPGQVPEDVGADLRRRH
jgi:hypothetical protein